LGSSFAQLGVYSAARDAFLVVAATAHEQYLRWTAMINLLDIAVDEGREPTFEKYRRELEDVSLPPSLATYFYIYVAKGHRAFDHPLLAKVAITRAIELATMNKYGQALIEAEQSLDALENDEVRQRGALARANGATWSPAVMGIAHKLEQVRTLAGA
jgi:hypothetical protein